MATITYTIIAMALITALALSASIGATPIPINPTRSLCSPMMTASPDDCPEIETTLPTGLDSSTTTTPSPAALCPSHKADKALLSRPATSPTDDGPLVVGGLREFLRSNKMKMCELHEEYKSHFDEEDLNTMPQLDIDVLPDMDGFSSPARLNHSRHNNLTQLLFEHASFLTDFIRALDTLLQDQDTLTFRKLCNLSHVDEVMSGMCRILYGIHRILRICGFDQSQLQQLNTTPVVGYVPPQQNFQIIMRDLVILREVRHYADIADYNLGDLLDGGVEGINDCGSFQQLE